MQAERIKSLHEHIAHLAEKHSSRTALVSCDAEGKILSEVNFKELAEAVEAAIFLVKCNCENNCECSRKPYYMI